MTHGLSGTGTFWPPSTAGPFHRPWLRISSGSSKRSSTTPTRRQPQREPGWPPPNYRRGHANGTCPSGIDLTTEQGYLERCPSASNSDIPPLSRGPEPDEQLDNGRLTRSERSSRDQFSRRPLGGGWG